jgi:hypothetical protein
MISFPLDLPASPGFTECSLEASTIAGMTVGEFDAAQQVQDWTSDPGWKFGGSLPPMERATAATWLAWRLSMRGVIGCFYVTPPNGRTPRGSFAGTPLVNGGSQAGRILLADGFTNSAANVVLKGDYFSLGGGYKATRIKTSGGGATTKYFITIAAPSVNTQKYRTTLRLKNIGAKAVTVIDNCGGTQTVAVGAEAQVVLSCTGDGAANLQINFVAPASGDALDFIVWDPVSRRFGVDENLLPLANRDFTGFSAFSGATVTLTQGVNQRLYMALEDVSADSAGNAEIPIFPRLRESPIDNEPLVFTNPRGIFRIPSNSMPWNEDIMKYTKLQFNSIEAL